MCNIANNSSAIDFPLTAGKRRSPSVVNDEDNMPSGNSNAPSDVNSVNNKTVCSGYLANFSAVYLLNIYND